jgi:hypothetical protein
MCTDKGTRRFVEAIRDKFGVIQTPRVWVCVCVCITKRNKKINILKFTINPFSSLYTHTHIIVYLRMLFWLRFGNTRNPLSEAAAAATAEPFLPSQEWKEKTTHAAAAAHSWHVADKTQYHHPLRIGTLPPPHRVIGWVYYP